MSGFVERVIEDWLTSTDERGYQKAFVSCLIRQGHTVKYVSPHGPFEHGKDVVSVDPDGRLCAFQLKAGPISKAAWQPIRQEMLDACLVPVDVPGLRKRRPGRVVLVLSGRLSDPVRNEIGLLNDEQRERAYAEIEVVELSELVAMLASAFEDFFPHVLGPPALLIRLYLQDGRGPQDKAGLFSVLMSLCPPDVGQRKTRRALANVVVAAQFAAAPYRKAANHIAELDTWVLAACSILLIAKQKALLRSLWHLPFELCWQAIESSSEQLLSEAFSREDLLEEADVLVEPFFLPFRRILVEGYVGAAINARCILGRDVRDHSERLLELFNRERPIALWGEAAWNLLLSCLIALRHTPAGELIAEELASIWLRTVCPNTPQEHFDPYWSLGDALRSRTEETPTDTNKARISYTAASALDLLARRMRRRQVAILWPAVSRYDQARVVPSRDYAYLEWLDEGATVELHRLSYRASWSVLREDAFRQRASLFEPGIEKLLPFFLCTYAHRVDRSLAGELDYQTSSDALRQEWRD